MIPERALVLHQLLHSAWCIVVLATTIASLIEWAMIAERNPY